MDTNPRPPSIISIYDLDGAPIVEIEAATTVSYRLNGVGEANFVMSIWDEKCRQDVLEFGRLVVIRHEKLPMWSGPLDTPREWGGNMVTAKAYSAERLLYFRHGRMQKLKGSAGEIFEKMITAANQEGDLLLRMGTVWTGGGSRQRELNYKDLLREMQELAEMSQNDFGIEPEIGADGKLIYRAHWWEKRGIDCALGLKEGGDGANLELDTKNLREQGEIWNDITGYGDGATWASRKIYRAEDAVSIRRFGRRQKPIWYNGVTEAATLKENVEGSLKELAWPRTTFPCNVLNVGDTWRMMGLGNRLPIEMPLCGFSASGGVGTDARGRILAFSHGEAAHKVSVTIDKVVE